MPIARGRERLNSASACYSHGPLDYAPAHTSPIANTRLTGTSLSLVAASITDRARGVPYPMPRNC